MVGAGHVERLDPAGRAEQMLRGAGVKSVSGQYVGALQEPELVLFNDKMQVAAHSANGTIALRHLQFLRRRHFKSHLATMAAALVGYHLVASQLPYRRCPSWHKSQSRAPSSTVLGNIKSKRNVSFGPKAAVPALPLDAAFRGSSRRRMDQFAWAAIKTHRAA